MKIGDKRTIELKGEAFEYTVTSDLFNYTASVALAHVKQYGQALLDGNRSMSTRAQIRAVGYFKDSFFPFVAKELGLSNSDLKAVAVTRDLLSGQMESVTVAREDFDKGIEALFGQKTISL